MSDWIDALATHGAAGTPAVLVTVVAAKGSAPRPPGTRMVVAAQGIAGTIGGGHLEWKAIEIARSLIAGGGGVALHRFPLGASLGQCCGGAAQLLFEPLRGSAAWVEALAEMRTADVDCALVTPVRGDATAGRRVVTPTTAIGTLGSKPLDDEATALARAVLAEKGDPRLAMLGTGTGLEVFIDVLRRLDFSVVLFGAGHVGRALVHALAGIDCRIRWVDAREDAFPATVPANVDCVIADAPEAEVATAPEGAYFLVMTHSHPQDEALAERILARGDFAYFGLIGSASKRRQFEKRLEARGTPRSRLATMTCPIGIAGIAGKEPAVIAIAVAAELLQVRSRAALNRVATDRRSA
jgi:xanthine dehydrogenase accessory factor